MAITTRLVKGVELSHEEMDENFTDLRDGLNMMVPKTKGSGIKVDSLGTPTYGWHDLTGSIYVHDRADPLAPDFVPYLGTIRQNSFAVNDEVQLMFHVPHDYAPGTDIHIHTHWSHDSTLVTGGTVTWAYELTHAKGHNQGAFIAPILAVGIQAASVTPYQHLISEVVISISGGGANLLDTLGIEPDCLILGRACLMANTITVSSGLQPQPFLHMVDIHYQSTGVPTKQRTPDFWT